uniref:Nuclear-interacting partner of ALK/Rsm1-like C-terminal domain-containing protein n=1 Tax=Entomoneis paludosa TaxID=265537 RepID=A0A7S3DSA0_9STRA
MFHPQLSKRATDRLIEWYQSQLGQSHSVACPFRTVALEYWNTDHNKTTMRNSYSFLASVWPPAEVEWMEQPSPPTAFLVENVRQVWMSNDEKAQRSPPQMTNIWKPWASIPKEILAYPPKTSDNSWTLLDRLVEKLDLKQQLSLESEDVESLETALLLILFGWRKTADATEEEQEFSCPLCLASLTVPLVCTPVNDGNGTNNDATTTQEEQLVQTKRMRPANNSPWNAHRYYCPYTHGLEQDSDKPLWQVLVDKLLLTKEDVTAADQEETTVPTKPTLEPVSAWMQIHQLLAQGIATTTKKGTRVNDRKRRPQD